MSNIINETPDSGDFSWVKEVTRCNVTRIAVYYRKLKIASGILLNHRHFQELIIYETCGQPLEFPIIVCNHNDCPKTSIDPAVVVFLMTTAPWLQNSLFTTNVEIDGVAVRGDMSPCDSEEDSWLEFELSFATRDETGCYAGSQTFIEELLAFLNGCHPSKLSSSIFIIKKK